MHILGMVFYAEIKIIYSLSLIKQIYCDYCVFFVYFIRSLKKKRIYRPENWTPLFGPVITASYWKYERGVRYESR